MSDDKKKVKDLATELSLSTKEVLAAAKELGIVAAKVAASSLSETETSRLQKHFAPAGSDKPEVIVRRRRKASGDDSASATESESDSPAEKHEETPDKKKEATAARVIQRPGDEAPQKEATPEPAAPVAEPAPAPVESHAAASETPVAPVTAQEKTAPSEGVAAPKAEKRKDKEPAPQAAADEAPKSFARVVRPAAFSAEPERGADGQTVSSAPAAIPHTKQEHGDGQDGNGDAGKARRVDAGQSTSQVRVISRPDASQQQPRGQHDSRPGGGRPAGNRPGGNRPDGAAPGNRPGGAAPGNRPGGAAPGNRPGGNRPDGPGAGNRPGGNRPDGPGAGNRPSGPRPAGGAPSGGAPAPGGAFPPSSDNEQGKKKRQKGRRTVEFSVSRGKGGDEDIGWSKSSSRRNKGRKQRAVAPMGGTQPVKAVKRKIKVDEFIRVSDLAHQMQLKSGEIIKILFNLGVMATINQSLDIDTATLVAAEFDYEIEKVGFSVEDAITTSQAQEQDDPKDMVIRPPVVTIMGHVDHGKTSLLDAIRKASVVTGEAGGITQHIGAYHVTTKKGDIVFLDTPGHEAFTAMRARGAEVTDIVVLVVAADDGVMEQTKEAINHARAANVPIMVAVNKMDKEAANPDRVKRELAEQGLVAEDWGGDATFSYVSAKTREGLDELLELLALQAELLELKGNPKRDAVGHIVEAKLDKGRGSLGTVLIQHGTLRLGDSFVCGIHSGRVRAMFNDQGKKVTEATLSMPVEVQGFEGVPEAGEEFLCIPDEKTARRIAEARALKQRERELAKESKITLETFLARKVDSVEAAVLNLVVKSDVQGSLEAITDALHKLSTEKVRINVIHGGTGAISESDVLLSTASNAIIIGFSVRPTAKAKELAEQEKVDVRFYDIIYKLVEEVKSAMEGMLAPISREVFMGTADVRETFSVPKLGLVAGCHISDGKILRNARARLLRDGIVVHTGKIGSLRRFKDDVREVAKGYECGIGLENYNDVKVGDVIEAFEIVEEAATL